MYMFLLFFFCPCFVCKRYHIPTHNEFNMEIVVEEIKINTINLYKSLHIVTGADIGVTALCVCVSVWCGVCVCVCTVFHFGVIICPLQGKVTSC